MQRAFLTLILIALTSSQHLVNLEIASKKEDWNVDLTFDRLIIPKELLDIKKIPKAKLIEKASANFYHGNLYNADIYEIPITLLDSEKKKYENFIEIEILNFSSFSLKRGIIGLSPESNLKNALPLNLTLKYEPLKKEFLLIKPENLSETELYKFDITEENEKKVFYLDAILSYKLNIQNISLASQSSNQASICFNSLNFEVSDYFFVSPNFFFNDWDYFLSNFQNFNFGKVLMSGTEFEVLSANGKGYRVPYDTLLFEAYSGIPMKNCIKFLNFCDVYVGEFFLKRSGMVVYFKNEESEGGISLGASFSIKINSYEFESKYYFKFFFILILCISLIAVIVLYIIKRKETTRNNDNKVLYENLRPENSGI